MKHPPAFLFLLLATVANAADLTARWEGEVTGSVRPYRAELTIEAAGGGTSATLRLDGRYDLPVHDLDLSTDRIRFRSNLNGQKLTIDLALANDRLTGTIVNDGPTLAIDLHRLPDYAAPKSRAEAWAQDLETVSTRFLRFDKSFPAAAKPAIHDALASLAKSAATLDDDAIVVRLSEIVASSDNAHTRLYLLRNRTALRRMPVRLYWFRDGLFVVQATDAHRTLLGCRVERIGDTPVDAAQERVSLLFAGNASWRRYKGPYFLTSPEILHGTALAPDADRAAYTFRCDGNVRTAVLEALPLERKERPTEAWRDLSPHRVEGGWQHAMSTAAAPLFLTRPGQHYWMESLGEGDVVYFQYNRSQNMPDGESLADFGARLTERLDATASTKLIVDLRFNTGGNTGVARGLFETLATYAGASPARRVFVLTGPSTFSAGIYHAAQLALAPGVVLVGEPVGDVLDTWSEGGNLVLPNSGLTVHYTNGFHGYSTKDYPERRPYYSELRLPDHALDPHVTLAPRFAEYVAGADPLLDAVLGR